MADSQRMTVGVVVLFLAIAIILYAPVKSAVYSGAATSVTLTTTATITSDAPTGNSTAVTNPIVLAAGPSSTTVWCNVTIHDANGNTDIHNVNATLYYTGSAGLASADHTNNHYTNYTCYPGSAADNGSGVWRAYNCSFTFQYCGHVAKGGVDGMWWMCTIFANDTSGNINVTNVTDITLDPTVGIGTNQSSVAYGSLAPGSTSGGVEINITNWGNVIMDLAQAGTNMTNQTTLALGLLPNPDGQINVSQQNYSTDIAFASAAAMKIPNLSITNTTYNLPNATSCANGVAGQATQNRSAWYRLNAPVGQAPAPYQGYIILTASDGT